VSHASASILYNSAGFFALTPWCEILAGICTGAWDYHNDDDPDDPDDYNQYQPACALTHSSAAI